jgi:hypothetical protein
MTNADKLNRELSKIGLATESALLTKVFAEKRISVDEKKAVIIYQLKVPIQLEDGSTTAILEIQEPDGNALEYAGRHKGNDVAFSNALLARITGLPVGIIGRVKQRDYLVLGEIMGLFQ